MTSKIDWREFMNERHEHFFVGQAISSLNRTWRNEHSGRDGSEFTVEGLFAPHLDIGSRGLPVPRENLGRSCLTRVAGLVAVVSLPTVEQPPDKRDMQLGPPELQHRWLRDQDWSGVIDPQLGWGSASTSSATAHVFAFRVAAAPVELPPAETGELVHQELPAWWKRTVEWLELLTGVHVRPVDDFHWSEGTRFVYAWSDNDVIASVPGQSWLKSTPRLTSAWTVPNAWAKAVQLAGLDRRPPLSCILLMAALRAFREGEYRTCVADAGTAAEIALGEALRRIKRPPKEKDTLGTVATNARQRIDDLVPAAFSERMVGVRNRVIHDGAIVNVETAAVAFTLAQQVVHRVHPLLEIEYAGLTLRSSSK